MPPEQYLEDTVSPRGDAMVELIGLLHSIVKSGSELMFVPIQKYIYKIYKYFHRYNICLLTFLNISTQILS